MGSSTPPLLRLPGELRNKIYHLLVISDYDDWEDGEITVRRLDDSDFTLDTSSRLISLQRYQALGQTSSQLRGEVQSYLLDHGMFYVKYFDLVCRSFDREKMLRVSSVELDITYASCKVDVAPKIVGKLAPLCREGRLRKILIKGVYFEWKSDPLFYHVYREQAMDLVAKLGSMLNVETVGRDVSVQKGEETFGEKRLRSELYSRARASRYSDGF